MTKKELVEHLEKFDDDAIIQLINDDKVHLLEVDKDMPVSEEFRKEVTFFFGDQIG